MTLISVKWKQPDTWSSHSLSVAQSVNDTFVGCIRLRKNVWLQSAELSKPAFAMTAWLPCQCQIPRERAGLSRFTRELLWERHLLFPAFWVMWMKIIIMYWRKTFISWCDFPPLLIEVKQLKVKFTKIFWMKDQQQKQCRFTFTAIFAHIYQGGQ